MRIVQHLIMPRTCGVYEEQSLLPVRPGALRPRGEAHPGQQLAVEPQRQAVEVPLRADRHLEIAAVLPRRRRQRRAAVEIEPAQKGSERRVV